MDGEESRKMKPMKWSGGRGKRENPRHEFIKSYIEYGVTHRNHSMHTMKNYRCWLNKFYLWLQRSYGIDLHEVEENHIIEYKQFVEEEGARASTVKQEVVILRVFFKYLIKMGLMEGPSPYPDEIHFRQSTTKPHIIPGPMEIFRMRRRNVPEERSAVFELLLSSGMRIGELRQIRANDLKFGMVPKEIETNEPCPFTAGSIYLDAEQINIKRRKSRWVYFSRLAGRMLRRHMKGKGIDGDSDVPLFPYTAATLGVWLRKLGKGIVFPLERTDEVKEERQPGFQDIDIKAASKKIKNKVFLRAIKNEQERHRGHSPIVKKSTKLYKPMKRMGTNLHPHSLRYAFTCAQYYMSYFGERQNELRVMRMLGHEQFQMTMHYLKQLSLFNTDSEWKKLWIGRPDDWMIR